MLLAFGRRLKVAADMATAVALKRDQGTCSSILTTAAQHPLGSDLGVWSAS